MDLATTFKDAVYENKRIVKSDKLYGLVVENEDGQMTICHGEKLHKTTRGSVFPKGSWISFKLDINGQIQEMDEETNLEKFPQTHVHKNVVTVMSQGAAPNQNYELNVIAEQWKYLAWSTEWGVIGDPHLRFTRFSKDKIFNLRLIFNPGKQPVPPQTKYLWEIVEIFNCFDSNSHFQMLRAPWNIGRQNMKLEIANKQLKTGFIFKNKVLKNKSVKFVTTEDGKGISILENTLRLKVGTWIKYEKTIQLGMKADRAFAIEILGTHQRGQIITDKYDDNNKEEVFEIEFDLNLALKNHHELLKLDGFYIENESVKKIFISKNELNANLLRLKGHQKGVDFLRKTDVLLCSARYEYLEKENMMVWMCCGVISISKL